MVSKQDVSRASKELSELIPKLDVDAVGVVNLDDVKGSKLEESVRRLLPEARSVVVFAMEVYPEVLDNTQPGRTTGMASMNDLLACHTEYLSGRLTRTAYDVAKASRKLGMKALPLPATGCPYDTRFLEAVFSYKHAAEAAGMGYLGRSSLLVTPDFGPRVRLSCCLTEVPLASTPGAVNKVCEGCDICIENCPAGALESPQADESYAINRFACSIFGSASGGCSECMRLCPSGH
ncbi:hypothetical protein ACFLXF_00090 [Chloroflexota bacterium]